MAYENEPHGAKSARSAVRRPSTTVRSSSPSLARLVPCPPGQLQG
ncbi:hypothetical protein HMPREF9056_00050 [Actinomyces sp. oral taxon 170 str. F0386]|nr:hypothetical protein HMPREF9056_00050 [Actinomyces sp. oral taxon 170 str. F0386]